MKEMLEEHATAINDQIVQFNSLAEDCGADVIVAFRMSIEERDDFLEQNASAMEVDNLEWEEEDGV